MIRCAESRDASRIAEISVFSKRKNYRQIFHDDKVSFGEIQVFPLAKNYIENPKSLSEIWVYDDDFVKGFIHLDGKLIAELYVDPFFEHQGIGSALITFATKNMGCNHVWCLEKNTNAIRFYNRHGFTSSGMKKINAGTDEYIIELVL